MTYKIVFLKNVIQAEIYITNSNSNLIVLPALMEHHQHPPAPTSQQQLNHQINKSEDIIKKQQKIIEELMERVGRLEGTVSVMEGELAVIRNINNLLSCQLDEADSYS